MEYYFADGNQQRGPYALDQLTAQGLRAETLVWRDGMTDWKPAREVAELAGIFAPQQPTVAVTPASVSAVVPPAAGYSPLAYEAPSTTGNTNGMAIASMVLGIVALVTMLCDGFGLIPGILAIIFGNIARKQIARTDAQGRGMATAGIICGWIAVGLVCVGILLIIIAIAASHHH